MPHSTTTTTGLKYLDKATYTCEGYDNGGGTSLVCSKRAAWEGDETVCTGSPLAFIDFSHGRELNPEHYFY